MLNLFLKKNEIVTFQVLSRLNFITPIDKDDLADDLEISKKTLDRYLGTLSKELTTLPNKISILENKNTLLLLSDELNNKSPLMQMLAESLFKNSIPYQIIQVLAVNESIEVDTILTNMHISDSYLFQTISKANSFLKKYHIQIKTTDGRIGFHGPLENIFFISYLFFDFDYQLSEKKYILDFNLEKFAGLLTEHTYILLSEKEPTRLDTFTFFVEKHRKRFSKITFSENEAKDILNEFNSNFTIFKFDSIDKDYHDYLILVTFLSFILFKKHRISDSHLNKVASFLSKDTPFIIAINQLIDLLLQELPDFESKNKIAFSEPILMFVIYEKVFNAHILEIFDGSFISEEFSGGYSPLTRVMSDENSYKLLCSFSNSNPLLTDLESYHTVLNKYLTIAYYKFSKTTLHIKIDLQNGFLFETALAKQIMRLFNSKTITINNPYVTPDLIIANQIYPTKPFQHLYYYPNIDSQECIKEVFTLITTCYIRKQLQEQDII